MQSYANQYAQMFGLFKIGALSKDDFELHLDALVAGPMPRFRGIVTLPADLWEVIDAYGPSRHMTQSYSVVTDPLD
jgi:hypothetical protein